MASASPRRSELLSRLIPRFDIVPSSFAEDLPKVNPTEYARLTARAKALNVQQSVGDDCLIISADTVIELDGCILEKPTSAEHAVDMLTSLSGRSHQVITGVSIHLGKHSTSFHESTTVSFANVDQQMINSYVQTKEPLDKAGGYGYQGYGAFLIAGINGCYYNVVGLPLYRLMVELETFLSELSVPLKSWI